MKSKKSRRNPKSKEDFNNSTNQKEIQKEKRKKKNIEEPKVEIFTDSVSTNSM